ncbi:MAG TPA: GNAT family N-acetyltransferase [Chthoniobacterales bacterium]|jgi:GNAT superfamily N-acetyltransferase
MIVARAFPKQDLAPGDQRSHELESAGFQVIEVRVREDPDFERLDSMLRAQFGSRGEMEEREVLMQRLEWRLEEQRMGRHMSYRMLGIEKDGVLIAARDHTVIVRREPAPRVWVHLSHVFVAPECRRSGLARWMRAFPVGDAREVCREIGIGSPAGITLVAEMEPVISGSLLAYAAAGFRRVDPARVSYYQPDFRSYREIAAAGGACPLPLWLMIRQVGREAESILPGGELRGMLAALYAMYAQSFRARDMTQIRAEIEKIAEVEDVPLQDVSAAVN